MKKTITICSSASFYEHANEVADELREMGFEVIVPYTARLMKERADYDLTKYKTWYENEADFHKKKEYVDGHIKEVEKADAILVVNDAKKDIEGYIGMNVMMEMAIAYYLKKPIFVMNPIGKDHPAYEEVIGMESVILNNDLSNFALK